jgi:hypothetical protein
MIHSNRAIEKWRYVAMIAVGSSSAVLLMRGLHTLPIPVALILSASFLLLALSGLLLKGMFSHLSISISVVSLFLSLLAQVHIYMG